MKKTMFKKVFAGITAMFMMCLFLPIGFTGTDFKPSLETVAESDVLTISQGTTIDDCQFRGNTSIKEVKIGDNCTIGAYAFSGCTNLETVEIGKNCIIGTWAFENCLNLSSVTIGEGCEIESNAFGDCTNLKNVTIGNGCTIGKMAFYKCIELADVTIGEGCKVAEYAFPSELTNKYSEGSIEIYNPDSVLSAYADSFSYYIDSFNKKTGVLTVNNTWFSTPAEIKKYVKKVEIVDGCTIGINAFWDCTNLETVEIGKNCIIGTGAFENCLNLSSVTIGEGCKIESNAFGDCTNLKNVTIGNGCTIGEMAFYKCKSLADVTIGEGCKVAEYAFPSEWTNKYENYDPDSVASAHADSFNKETGVLTVNNTGFSTPEEIKKYVKKVEIVDGCTIKINAFGDCTNLETVEIGKNCIIGTWAFKNCLNLSSVTIGEGCTIGEMAFWKCTALENVIFNGTCVEADKISVGDGNPAIITNKSKWKIDHAFGKNGKCKICGYCKKISKSEIGSTFSNGSVLVIIGGSIFLILCGLAAVIIVKRRKKTQ